MKIDNVPRVEVKALSNSADEISCTLTDLLTLKSMTLLPDQHEYAVRQIAEDPTVLYLRLALGVVSNWTSFGSFQGSLPATVPCLIDSIFDEVEAAYGPVLTRTSLALITFSSAGVSDIEMTDILSK